MMFGSESAWLGFSEDFSPQLGLTHTHIHTFQMLTVQQTRINNTMMIALTLARAQQSHPPHQGSFFTLKLNYFSHRLVVLDTEASAGKETGLHLHAGVSHCFQRLSED